MKTLLLIFFLMIVFITDCISQNAGIGTTTPNTSAKLEVASNNSGFLLPRMTTAERNAIVSPATGLMVFDIEKSAFYFYNGNTWMPLLSSSPNNIPPVSMSVADGAAGDSLGWSVAISGNYAIAGAPGDDIGANADQGSAYIFFKQNGIWTEQAKLTASDGAAGDAFGFSVSVSGDYAIIGAYLDDGSFTNQGSAYVFVRSGTIWSQQAKLIATTPAPVAEDWFGYSVSISGDYALVGVLKDDVSVTDQGSAYIFIRSGSTWSQQANLTHATPATSDGFGTSVSLSGDYAVIGTPNRNGGMAAPWIGVVYIYLRSGINWALQANLFGAVPGEKLGQSVSISGANLTAGTQRSLSASADVYTRSGTVWSFILSIGPPSGVAGDAFSTSTFISNDYIIGGAPGADLPGYNNVGASLLFKKNGATWLYLRRIEDNAGQVNGAFGYAGAADGFYIITGAPGKNTKKRGSVFFKP